MEKKNNSLYIKYSKGDGFVYAQLNGYNEKSNTLNSILNGMLYNERNINDFCDRILRSTLGANYDLWIPLSNTFCANIIINEYDDKFVSTLFYSINGSESIGDIDSDMYQNVITIDFDVQENSGYKGNVTTKKVPAYDHIRSIGFDPIDVVIYDVKSEVGDLLDRTTDKYIVVDEYNVHRDDLKGIVSYDTFVKLTDTNELVYFKRIIKTNSDY